MLTVSSGVLHVVVFFFPSANKYGIWGKKYCKLLLDESSVVLLIVLNTVMFSVSFVVFSGLM